MSQKKILSGVRSERVTVVFDLDGVLATGSKEEVYSDAAGWAYGKCRSIPETVGVVRRLWKDNYKIVIHTSRPSSERAITEQWLSDRSIPYHELIMDKPFGDVYIDDKAVQMDDDKARDVGMLNVESIIRVVAQKFFDKRKYVIK